MSPEHPKNTQNKSSLYQAVMAIELKRNRQCVVFFMIQQSPQSSFIYASGNNDIFLRIT